MQSEALKKPIWAYIFIFVSVMFLFMHGIKIALGAIALIVSVFQGEMSILHLPFYFLAVVFLYLWYRLFKKAWREIRAYQKNENPNQGIGSEKTMKITLEPNRKWMILGVLILALLFLGPGIIFLPIAPLFLAAMSTDSGTVPDYVPVLIMVLGYSLLGGIGYFIYRLFKNKK